MGGQPKHAVHGALPGLWAPFMESKQRREECLAKATEAEQQVAKVTERRIRDGLLKLAATYREMAKVYSG